MDELVTWLRGVLDEADDEAQLVLAHDEVSGVAARARQTRARVEAERRLIALHETVQNERRVPGTHRNALGVEVYNFEPVPGSYSCTLCSDSDDGQQPWPCPSLRLLGWSHRHDRDGWQEEWMPAWVLEHSAVS